MLNLYQSGPSRCPRLPRTRSRPSPLNQHENESTVLGWLCEHRAALTCICSSITLISDAALTRPSPFSTLREVEEQGEHTRRKKQHRSVSEAGEPVIAGAL